MLWRDKMIKSEGKGIVILDLESKSKEEFVLVRKNEKGKITLSTGQSQNVLLEI